MRAVIFLCVAFGLVSLLSACGPVRAQRDLVFAAQYYQRVSPSTLRAQGAYHLYRINADGSHRTRLTFGTQDDVFPQWSPDGKRVLFLRLVNYTPHSVCIVEARGGKVTRLMLTPRRRSGEFRRYAWAPNGKSVAVVFQNFGSASPPDYTLSLIDVLTHKAKSLINVRDFAWSPDSRKLYLDRKGGDQIWEVKTGKRTRVRDEVDNPFWLDNRSILGTYGEMNRSPRHLRVISGRDIRWSQPLVPTTTKTLGMDTLQTITLLDSVTWHRTRTSSPLLLAQKALIMSDGTHYACYAVNSRTGRYRPLREGQMLGFSTRTGEVAIANDQWVGEYKRGGARVGPIQLVSVKTRKVRTLTHGLTAIAGGDWREHR